LLVQERTIVCCRYNMYTCLTETRIIHMKIEPPVCAGVCPVEAALDIVGGKWKGLILYYLRDETRRFNELRRLIPGVSQRMLTRQLRELETDRIIHREIYRQIPPKVEYSLTGFGKTLSPILASLEQWGMDYVEDIAEIRNRVEVAAE